MIGQIAGLNRNLDYVALCSGGAKCPPNYHDSFMVGYRAGIGQTLTKAGVKAALISKGYSEFPNALKAVDASKNFIREEMEFAEYLVADSDFGGAWNDNQQVNMHLK